MMFRGGGMTMLPRSWSGFITREAILEILLHGREYRVTPHEAQFVVRVTPQGIEWEFTFLPAESTGIRATRLPGEA